MPGVGSIKKLQGEDYRLVPLTDEYIEQGVKLGFKNGRIFRRILCVDGDEVILRGCTETRDDVIEAVPMRTLAEDWYRLEPLDGEA